MEMERVIEFPHADMDRRPRKRPRLGWDVAPQALKEVNEMWAGLGYYRQRMLLSHRSRFLSETDVANHTLFHKALKEAFEVFCLKQVFGCSSAELLASFCDNILKKGGNEKLNDEAIEDTLDKVVKLLAYVSDKDLYAEFYSLRYCLPFIQLQQFVGFLQKRRAF